MGVKIKLEDIGVKHYLAETLAQHADLAAQLSDKVVAIDIAHWMYQSEGSGARALGYMTANAENPLDPETEWVQNTVSFCIDRLIQLLRYGAHPVVVRPCSHCLW